MDQPRTARARLRSTVPGAIGLLAAIGAAAFWWWREHAPLARRYLRANGAGDGNRGRQGSRPDPEREPGTGST